MCFKVISDVYTKFFVVDIWFIIVLDIEVIRY